MVLFAVAGLTFDPEARLNPMFSVILVSFSTIEIGPATPVSGSNPLPSLGMAKV